MIITTSQAAEIFGVTHKTISLWVKRGMPKHKHGHYDAALAVQWWGDNVFSGNDSEGILEAKESYWKAKARNETIKADTSEGKVMPIEDFRGAWAWRVSEVFKGLLSWSLMSGMVTL
jgi:phage terminase Nu1 subunit (DNA packaging protein)